MTRHGWHVVCNNDQMWPVVLTIRHMLPVERRERYDEKQFEPVRLPGYLCESSTFDDDIGCVAYGTAAYLYAIIIYHVMVMIIILDNDDIFIKVKYGTERCSKQPQL